MEFLILGAVEVRVNGYVIDIPGGRARVLLAALALHAGQVVSRDRLIQIAWGDAAPTTATTQLQGLVSALRRALAPDSPIETQGSGYVLRAAPGAVDVARFRDAVTRARAARDAGNLALASELFRVAHAEWRGLPLDGLESAYLQEQATRLEDEQLTVAEEHTEVALRLGDNIIVITSVSALVDDYPLREGLCAALMLALYRAGRQADALARYQRTRDALVEELGIEPGAELRRLHERILNADPTLDEPEEAPGPPRPVAQLPPDVADFTGRASQAEQILTLLTDAGGDTAPTVVAVAGAGGVGKTTLAVHVAHLLRDQYPDGQLFINLRAGSGQPISTCSALSRLLRTLGVDERDIPVDEDERAALYRSLLTDRRILVVLDDAYGSAQVRPLLPGGPGCGVLLTSRSTLAGLAGCHRVEIDIFDRTEARQLFTRIIGADRAAAEPGAVARVLEACDGLPLALRIAGARLATRGAWTVATLADRLDARHRRLDELQADDLAVRASFEVSYEAVGDACAEASRAFRMLGLWQGPDISLPAVATLLDVDPAEAEAAMDTLVDAHLVQEPAAGRYRLHDLLRQYASELAARDPHLADGGDDAAVRRLLAWYVHAGNGAMLIVAPHRHPEPLDSVPMPKHVPTFADHSSALAWLETERANLVAAVRLADARRVDDVTRLLPNVILYWFILRRHLGDWRDTQVIRLANARRTGDRSAEADALNCLAHAHVELRDFPAALAAGTEALRIMEETRPPRGRAAAYESVAMAHYYAGDLADAARYYERALSLRRAEGEAFGLAATLNNIGELYLTLGRPEDAAAGFLEALDIARDAGFPHVEVTVLHNLAELHERHGRAADAIGKLERALRMARELGDQHSEATILTALGRIVLASGDPARAHDHFTHAAEVFDALGDRKADDVRLRLRELK